MQHRTEDTKVWAYSNTGTKAHAFLRVTADGRLQAACRAKITRNADALVQGREKFTENWLCTSCVKHHDSYLARVEASMEPATEAQDLGHVHVETEAAEPVLSNESDIRKYLAGMDKDALTNLLAGTEQAAAESVEGQVFHTWVREEMDKRITYVQAPELMQRIRDLAPAVTDYELPGSLVDVVYAGMVLPEDVELIEDRECSAIVVHGPAAGHRRMALTLAYNARNSAQRHQAARYGRWADSL